MGIPSWLDTLRRVMLLVPALAMTACAAVDGAIPSRVSTLNNGADDVRNEAILLNIVRASQEQPLTFVALSKITNGGNISGGFGLPTLNFGRGQTPAQHVYSFGPGNFGTQISTNVDVGVIETRDFYAGILAPITMVQFDGLRNQGFPRELLFNTVLESIKIEDVQTHEAFEYRNDPSLEVGMDCPDFDYARADLDDCLGPNRDERACQSPYSPAAPDGIRVPDRCNYHRFRFFLERGLRYGLSSETRAKAEAAPKAAASDKKAVTEVAEAHICFDAALARRDLNRSISAARSQRDSVCDGRWLQNPKKENVIQELPFEWYRGGQVVQKSSVKVIFVFRSTYGVFRYLGRILGRDMAERVQLHVPDEGAPMLTQGQPLLEIIKGMRGACFAQVSYGDSYCVPRDGAVNTKRLFAILSQLIALNTNRQDLPITPTVQFVQ